MEQTVQFAKGLEGVIAGESTICKIDGEKGQLYYRGYPIQELAEKTTFEETTYLLLYGELPNRDESVVFSAKMRNARDLSPAVLEMIRNFPEKSHPMELLQSVIAYLSAYVEHKIHHGPHCNCRETLHQVAQLASVVAAYERIRNGLEYVPPKRNLGHGANFLYMLRGEEPTESEGKIMDSALVMHAEHSFNASTFTARVIASTQSTCYSSISGAIGALYGSLHGGANEKVMVMVDEIGTPQNVVPWLDKTLGEGKKVMGMGHRVYKAKDPRSNLMEAYLKELCEAKGDMTYYDILKTLEVETRKRMEQKGKPVYPNVDFFSGAVYRLLGIPTKLFTPIFAMGRVSGWLAHVLEQRIDNRIYRPKALYNGPEPRSLS
ncbi:MAG: citrate/2-methylcitrate synthase [Spirochaetales bacterium]|nr:citrate/2-methylcitrate synthase [Spirochaetales bacterium]